MSKISYRLIKNEISPRTLERMGMQVDVTEIVDRIKEFIGKHPLLEEVGGEYIYQDDKATEDTIELVADISDILHQKWVEEHEKELEEWGQEGDI